MKGKLIFFCLTLLIFLPVLVGAQEGADATTPFRFLVGIPGVDGSITEGSFNGYVNALYAIAIGIAGLLAVIKLIVAGTKYMLSDIVTTKQEAKNDIKWALVGLLVVLGAVVILTTINTDLTNVDVNLTELDGDTTNYLAENLERIRSIEDNCDQPDSNCAIVNCPPLRDGTLSGLSDSCREWCEDLGSSSRYIGNGLLSKAVGLSDQITHQCFVQTRTDTDATGNNVYQCRVRNWFETILGSQRYDCSDAYAACESNGGTPYPATRTDTRESIACVT